MANWENGSFFVSGYATLHGTGSGTAGTVPQQQPAAARPGVAVDGEWRRWVAEDVLLRNEPSSIVDAMVKNGVDRAAAAREVQAAMDHPYITAARKMGASGQAGAAAGNMDAKLQKRDWVLECYRRAAKQATTYGQVPRVPKLSRQEFLDNYYALNRPVVMTGAM